LVYRAACVTLLMPKTAAAKIRGQMTRIAILGTLSAAVLLVAAGFIYVIAGQEGEDTPLAGASAAQPDFSRPAVKPPSDIQPSLTSGAQQPAGAFDGLLPHFTLVRVNPNGDAVVAGMAAAGSLVQLRDSGALAGTAYADDRGEWVLLPYNALTPGVHWFDLSTRTKGNVQDSNMVSDDMVLVIVPAPAHDIAGRHTDRPGGALALQFARQGFAPSHVLNAPEPQSQKERIAAVETADYEIMGKEAAKGWLAFSGWAPPKARLSIFLGGAPLGEVTADAKGRWTFLSSNLPDLSEQQLGIDLAAADGKTFARLSMILNPWPIKGIRGGIEPQAQPSSASADESLAVAGAGDGYWYVLRPGQQETALTLVFSVGRQIINLID